MSDVCWGSVLAQQQRIPMVLNLGDASLDWALKHGPA